MIEFAQFEANLQAVKARITKACEMAQRSQDAVSLLPVTKNHPLKAVEFAAACGLQAVGENRVQEATDKHNSYTGKIRWELIGHLQSNKAKDAVAVFDRIQSVDSLKLMRRLNRFSAEVDRRLPILIQVNTGEDPKKYGFSADEAGEAMEAALGSVHLRVDGLMTVAPHDDDPDVARRAFDGLRELRDQLGERFGETLPELSMGMTGDLEAAIAAGSTQIRVGTALYGERQY